MNRFGPVPALSSDKAATMELLVDNQGRIAGKNCLETYEHGEGHIDVQWDPVKPCEPFEDPCWDGYTVNRTYFGCENNLGALDFRSGRFKLAETFELGTWDVQLEKTGFDATTGQYTGLEFSAFFTQPGEYPVAHFNRWYKTNDRITAPLGFEFDFHGEAQEHDVHVPPLHDELASEWNQDLSEIDPYFNHIEINPAPPSATDMDGDM